MTEDSAGVLLPYQKRWIEDAAEWKIAEKGRRTGLTWAEAADAALAAGTAPGEGGCNHSYVGSGKDMAREFIDAVAMWAGAFERAASDVREEVLADGDRDITVFRVDFASGHHVQALSSNPSNLRGRKGNVTIDEAAFQPSLLEVVKAAAALTMWGGKVRVISTHNGDESEFNELLADARAGRNDYSVHRIPLDEACEQGLYRRICQVAGREWSAEAERAWKAPPAAQRRQRGSRGRGVRLRSQAGRWGLPSAGPDRVLHGPRTGAPLRGLGPLQRPAGAFPRGGGSRVVRARAGSADGPARQAPPALPGRGLRAHRRPDRAGAHGDRLGPAAESAVLGRAAQTSRSASRSRSSSGSATACRGRAP